MDLMKMLAEMAESQQSMKERATDLEREFPEAAEIAHAHQELKEKYQLGAGNLKGFLDEKFEEFQKEINRLMQICECCPASLRDWGYEYLSLKIRTLSYQIVKFCDEERKPKEVEETKEKEA